MTAGAGIIHSEMPSQQIREKGGRVHGFQVWVNLPRRDKLMRPRYQEVSGDKLPEGRSDDGKARAKIIAGEALGAKAVIDTRTPIVFQDWTVQPGADVTVPFAENLRMLAYVFEGEVQVDDKLVREGQLAILGAGEAVRLSGGASTARVLLLGGVPLREPVARYGPFVMTNRAELVQAFEDFESGTFAKWKIEGEAFGRAPQIGTLAGQQAVSGFAAQYSRPTSAERSRAPRKSANAGDRARPGPIRQDRPRRRTCSAETRAPLRPDSALFAPPRTEG